MSGHDIADEAHETTHELVWTTEFRGMCGQTPPCSNCADVRIPVQWTRWPNVKPREVPATERRQGPRASRFNDLEHA